MRCPLSDGGERVDRNFVDGETAQTVVNCIRGKGPSRAEAREIDLQTLEPTSNVLQPQRRRKESGSESLLLRMAQAQTPLLPCGNYGDLFD